MKYELINPSDLIFFDACSDIVALFCVLMIISAYGAKNIETDWTGPMYLFGITDDQLDIELEMDVDSFVNINREDINNCFQSFRYNSERSSMNNIVDRAHGLKLKEAS